MASFNDLINGEQAVLVDFFAEWCGPCKTMAPILKQTVSMIDGKAKILKVDVDKNPSVAQKYNVRGVPTMILFHKGQIKWRQSGVVPAQQLAAIIKENVN